MDMNLIFALDRDPESIEKKTLKWPKRLVPSSVKVPPFALF